MIDGLINVMTPARQVHPLKGEADEALESAALTGAEAIQRIITDRNSLRTLANAQQRNLAALSATNEEFRRRLALLRRNYVELATTILAQLEQFDQATRHALRDHDHDAATQSDDANLVALAHRLKPDKEFSPGNEGTPQSDNAA